MPPTIQKGSKLERLLSKNFSGDTEKMFNALQGQLKKSAVQRSDFGSGQDQINRAVFLRAFIKGLNLLRIERKESIDMTSSENLFSFRPRIGSRGAETSGALDPIEVPSVSRLPLPSISSVARHLTNYTEVKTIKSRHLEILKLDLQGIYSRGEIAKMIGCSEPTITNVLKSEAVQSFKRRALLSFEDEYSSLMKPAIAAVRESLMPRQDIGLRQDTAFKYLRTQGKGGENFIQHDHRHSHSHGGTVEITQHKMTMLKKLGINIDDVVEGEFQEVASD